MPGTHPSKMPDGTPITKSTTVPNAKNETTVNGETINMILQDPLGALVKNESDELSLDSVYVKEGSDRYNELLANLDPTYLVEHIQFYEIVPYVNGEKKSGELANTVRLLYEIPTGWDREDMEAVLVREDKDLEFDEKLETIDGKDYLVLWTNHFSPYVFIDTLSEEEKEALNQDNKPNSGDSSNGTNNSNSGNSSSSTNNSNSGNSSSSTDNTNSENNTNNNEIPANGSNPSDTNSQGGNSTGSVDNPKPTEPSADTIKTEETISNSTLSTEEANVQQQSDDSNNNLSNSMNTGENIGLILLISTILAAILGLLTICLRKKKVAK